MKHEGFFLLTALLAGSGIVAGVTFSAQYRHIGTTATNEFTSHIGNHYEAKSPTGAESGWEKFWACCVCGCQYVAPVTPKDIHVYRDNCKLSIGDKATIIIEDSGADLASFGNGHDYRLDPSSEVDALCQAAYDSGLACFYLPAIDPKGYFQSYSSSALRNAGYTNFSGRSFGLGETTYWLFKTEM